MRDRIIVKKDQIPYGFHIALGKEKFNLRFRYNQASDLFTVSLYRDGVLLCASEPVIYGVLEERVEAIERRLGTVECTLKTAEEDLGTVKRKVINLELNLENRTDRNLRILAENHLSLIEKLDGVVLIAERTRLQGLEISNLRSRVECVEEKLLKLEGQSA